ncbi:MAG: hypothetical protein K6F72_09055 [Bacteroidales bacterium]|nr:hypothetical protein [Bacteroidales bacterium]
MNRISHFLHAKTQYNLHSPFVYRLYTEVLFSHCPGRGRHYADVVWRLEEYYGLPHSPLSTLHSQLTTPDGLFLIVADTHSEEWDAIVASKDWQVTLDLYHCGVAVSSPRLSKQHFLLR